MKWWVCTVLLLAGCLSGPQESPDAVTVAQSRATGAGTQSDEASCPAGTARLAGIAVVDEGTLVLVVEDGGGDELLRRTFEGRTDLDGHRLDGDDGDWTLRVEHGDGFDGGYSFTLVCRGTD